MMVTTTARYKGQQIYILLGEVQYMDSSQLAILVHDALKNANYETVPTTTAPGYLVAAVKTFAGEPVAVEVSHTPNSDDPYGHALRYYHTLASNGRLAGLSIEFVEQPYPLVRVKG